MQRAVFLGRDGVLNATVYNAESGTVDSPASPEEFELLPVAGARIGGVVGQDGEYTVQDADACVIPSGGQCGSHYWPHGVVSGFDLAPARVPSQAEGFQDEVGIVRAAGSVRGGRHAHIP